MDERIGVVDLEWTVIGPLLSSERGRWRRPMQDKRCLPLELQWLLGQGNFADV